MSLPFPAVLVWHCRHYPLLRAQDIYKLIHQGVFGPGHIIASAARARLMLKEEMAALEARSPHCLTGAAEAKFEVRRRPEPGIEPIDPNGRLVRVNLRPMFGEGGRMRDESGKRKDGRSYADVGWLVAALVESARRVKGNPERMKRRLSAAVRWCRTNLPRQAAELERMAAQAEELGFPAFHHSSAYAKAYRPAYRVILSDCLKARVSGRAG